MLKKTQAKVRDLNSKKILASWIILALYVAYQRSLWGDEFIRFEQYKLGLVGSLKSLFLEPSPFTPGESVLIWLSGKLFSAFIPLEIWMRLPGILWGSATIALALSLPKRPTALLLSFFLFFSVTLCMLSVEARTYGSLIFSGALAMRLLIEPNIKKTKWLSTTTFLTLLFTHVYGLAFIGTACAIRRSWKNACFAFGFLITVFIGFKLRSPLSFGVQHYNWFEIVRQTLGTLFGPHKLSLVLLPLFSVGVWQNFKTNKRQTLILFAMVGICIGAPLFANVRSGFVFLPRQITAGLFGALFFSVEGLLFFAEHFKLSKPMRLSAATVCIGIVATPFLFSVLLKIPPFPNQPFHRFREIAQEINSEKNLKNIFFLDACNSSNFEYYLEKSLNINANDFIPEPTKTISGYQFKVACAHTKNICLFTALSLQDCTNPQLLEALKKNENFAPDIIVHSSTETNTITASGRHILRSW